MIFDDEIADDESFEEMFEDELEDEEESGNWWNVYDNLAGFDNPDDIEVD